ncbi:MAG TPA: hypothetical protein VMY78_14750 [Solirubrobacteraceae bacterium]|nr:hypothetical protein [Solirubrobacteraceae bacterium]
MTGLAHNLRDEGGTTMVELLVVCMLSLVLMLATLLAFDSFGRSATRNEKLTNAQDSLRQRVDVMSREIRNAQVTATGLDPLLRADPNDLIVRNIDNAGTATLVRYCLATATRTLWRETAPDNAALESACPSAGASWQRGKVADGTLANTAADPIFKPNTTTLSAIRSVEIAPRLDTGNESTTTPLRTAVSLRSASRRSLSIDASALRVTCQADHSALLELTVGTDPNGSPLSATAATAGSVSIGSFGLSQATTVGTSVQGTLTVVVRNALGLQQILFKNVTCP